MNATFADGSTHVPRLLGRSQRWSGQLVLRLVVALVAVTGVVATVGVAWAYWSAEGGGTGVATAGSMAAPATPTAEVSAGSADVAVSWAAVRAPGGGQVDGYHVQRHSGGTSTPACDSGPSTLLPATPTSCTDVGVPNGEFTYTVTAVTGSWTAESSASAAVSVEVLAFRVEAPASVVAGELATVTVTAEDGSGARLTGYRGTVQFSSSDPASRGFRPTTRSRFETRAAGPSPTRSSCAPRGARA